MDICVPPVDVFDEPRPDHIHRMPQTVRFSIGKP